jgi:hypothetical protein
MKIIVNQEIKDGTIDIDDQFFLNCTLIGCALTFSRQNFRMQNCRIVDCRVCLVGEAATMARPLKQLRKANNRVILSTLELA